MAKAKKQTTTTKKKRAATASKKPTKKSSRPQTIINALPFRQRRRKSDPPWWTVKPSGDYAANLETGRNYARAFLPLLEFNVGPVALGWIVDMTLAGRANKGRAIDDIALGYTTAIGGQPSVRHGLDMNRHGRDRTPRL